MIRARQRFIFALDVDGKPTTAFEANNLREARELCKEKWLRDDLRALRSNGVAPNCRAAYPAECPELSE
jgi:hypothetical protein